MKKQKSRMNLKISLLFVSIFLLASISVLVVEKFNSEEEKIEYNGVELKIEDYYSAREIFKDEVGFAVCNLKSMDCASFLNFENINKEMQNRQS